MRLEVGEDLIEVQNLSVRYEASGGGVDAIRGISISVNRGDLLVLVGPSGCGKSTLLHSIAGFIAPTEGRILEAGSPIDGPGPHRGIVFQRPALYPWLTVRQNVEFGPRMRGTPKRRRRDIARRYLELVHLRDAADLYPYELSGGMQQRASIARALAGDPQLLLMDEPFGALDALTRERLQEELLQIWDETHKTIVFVTHSVDEAVFLATRIAVMSAGPGSIVEEIPVGFSRRFPAQSARAIKASEEFVRRREYVLGLILGS